MKKIVKVTESELVNIIKRVLKEQSVVGAANQGIINYSNPSDKKIPSLSCVPLAFQFVVNGLIKQGYDKKLLKASLGIIGRESDFGESNRYKFLSPLKTLWSSLGGNTSVGPGQIKPETAEKFGMTVYELTTAYGSLKTVYSILQQNYQKSLQIGYTTEPTQNFTKGTGDAALDLSIAAYNLGISKITKYCKTSDPNIKKPCNLAGKTIQEQDGSVELAMNRLNQQQLKSIPNNKKSIKVFNEHVKNYLPNFKTKRWDGVSISSHGYVEEVASKMKKYTCF